MARPHHLTGGLRRINRLFSALTRRLLARRRPSSRDDGHDDVRPPAR